MSADPGRHAAQADRHRGRRRDGPGARGRDDPRRVPRDGVDTPTMCYADNLTPINACRVCVVEVEGSRVLVPACSRKAEAGMKVSTDTERVRHSRKLVMEFLGSSVDTSARERRLATAGWTSTQAHPERFGAAMEPMPAGERDDAGARPSPRARIRPSPRPSRSRSRSTTSSTCATTADASSATSASRRAASTPRTRSRSPSPAAGSTRGSPPSTPCRSSESACVYCGNCIGVCPTGALMFTSEHDMREAGTWDESRADRDEHDLPLLRRRVRARAPRAGQRDREGDLTGRHSVTNGHLCIKGRFGFQFVQRRRRRDDAAAR